MAVMDSCDDQVDVDCKSEGWVGSIGASVDGGTLPSVMMAWSMDSKTAPSAPWFGNVAGLAG
jgi:hypothetical protein